MRTIFYNKFFSGISISFFISYLLKQFVFKDEFSIVYAMSCFGALYLLLCWTTYLKLDGVHFFKSKSMNLSTKKLDRFWYKKKGVYNLDKDYDISNNIELSENQMLKVTFFAYLSCSILLFIASQLYHQHLIQWLFVYLKPSID